MYYCVQPILDSLRFTKLNNLGHPLTGNIAWNLILYKQHNLPSVLKS